MSAPPKAPGPPLGPIRAAASAILLGAAPALGQAPQAGSWAEAMARQDLLGLESQREALAERGLELDLYYTAYLGWNTRGGRTTSGAHRYSHSFDFFVRADSERLGLWSGGSALMQVKNNYGENINPYVGALSQVVDDADFDESIYIDQLYYEHSWREAGLRLRLGYLDYQTIIDRNAYANSEDVKFMNAALDNDLLVPLKIGFGATLFVEPSDWLGVIVGTADADNKILLAGFDTAFEDDDNLMAFGEVTLKTDFETARGALPGNYRWGVWYDPRTQPVYGQPGSQRGTLGTWLSLDQLVFREGQADRQGLGLFFRYGYRDEHSYKVSQLHSGGLEYLGPLAGRDADAFGLAYYELVASDDYRQVAPSFVGEAGLESYYRYQATPWFAITPGVQYVADPGGSEANSDALAIVLRTRITF